MRAEAEELSPRRFSRQVRLPLEEPVGADGQEVELRGILESISNRFYSGGWGFGTLQTEQGLVKITGTLEGHVAGTSLVVRGSYKDSNYGLQLDCTSIVVDSVSGDMHVIRSWVRKACKDHESEVVRVTRMLDAAERWPLLANAKELERAGLAEDVARLVGSLAKAYLKLIETKKGLMELGFTDHEAEAMCAAYGETVMQVLADEPYSIVLDRILAFHRVDAVVAGRVPRNHPPRLQAALVQALAGGLRNGHTAMSPKGAQQEAAEIAGVYLDAMLRIEIPKKQITTYDGKLQLRPTAWAEADIAAWIWEAVKLEREQS